jgi:hypothetical protein
MQKLKKIKFNLILCVLAFIYVLFLFFTIIISYFSQKNKDEAWTDEFIKMGIESISMVFENNKCYDLRGRGAKWIIVKSVYMNGKKYPIELLYRKNDFVKRKNNKYFYYGFCQPDDSLVIKFYPELINQRFKNKYSPYNTARGRRDSKMNYEKNILQIPICE